jgi:hypothetical protein
MLHSFVDIYLNQQSPTKVLFVNGEQLHGMNAHLYFIVPYGKGH